MFYCHVDTRASISKNRKQKNIHDNFQVLIFRYLELQPMLVLYLPDAVIHKWLYLQRLSLVYYSPTSPVILHF